MPHKSKPKKIPKAVIAGAGRGHIHTGPAGETLHMSKAQVQAMGISMHSAKTNKPGIHRGKAGSRKNIK
jgi:hypothetical protein